MLGRVRCRPPRADLPDTDCRIVAAVSRRIHTPSRSSGTAFLVSAGARCEQGGQEAQAQGRSRGGFGTKLHVLVDAQGRLLEGVRPDYVLADRSYDDDDLRLHIVAQGSEPVIPGRRNRQAPIDYDWVRYWERNIMERSIGWLKQGRRIATRCEKTAASYLGFVLFAAARPWLRNPFANVHTPKAFRMDKTSQREQNPCRPASLSMLISPCHLRRQEASRRLRIGGWAAVCQNACLLPRPTPRPER